jgi:hypothetical protein
MVPSGPLQGLKPDIDSNGFVGTIEVMPCYKAFLTSVFIELGGVFLRKEAIFGLLLPFASIVALCTHRQTAMGSGAYAADSDSL